LADVPPRVADRKVEAKILASTRPLGILGQNQLAFVSAGEKQGVAVGNRFLVVRQGDFWRRELSVRERLSGEERPDSKPLSDDKYPWEVIGELRVIYVRPETSTALVTDSILELNIGDRVELREGY
ncbi:MAG TPA: hypothetical protein VJU61_01130, partial [Polyangiaceae bacterium]|nr:hypothetical protein [Polyangiaceae bacterium]